MDSKKAFDLDGVLADKPPKSEKSWGKMKGPERKARQAFLLDWYLNAKPLLPWDGKSLVITARKNTPDVRSATMLWFHKQYGKLPNIHFLDSSRSIENVVRFKSEILSRHSIQEFYEDNKKVLQGVKEKNPGCKYFFVKKTLDIEPF